LNLQEVVEQEVEALSQETFQKKPTQAFSPKERLTSEFLYEINISRNWRRRGSNFTFSKPKTENDP